MRGRYGRRISAFETLTRLPRVSLVVGLALVLLAVGVWKTSSDDDEQMVIGMVSDTTVPPQAVIPTAPVPIPAPQLGRPPRAEPKPAPGLRSGSGRPYGRALSFRSSIPVKDGLVFVLVAGSDARPGESVRKARADSIHLLAIDPATRAGTIVGIPRDSWANIPGRGEAKINTALSSGGPALLVEAVRQLTGLPIHYYALTGFQGFADMVDELGGVDVHVDRRMNDRYSGARFARGWHHFSGADALAFARNRHDVANGDFSRSENHGVLLLAALTKLRAEIGDDAGLRRWLSVLARKAELDSPASELEGLAALARRMEPSRVQNVVVPGKVGTARGGQSVVYLGEPAARIFEDLRDDAVLGGAVPPPAEEPAEETTTTTDDSSTSTSSTTTSTPPEQTGG